MTVALEIANIVLASTAPGSTPSAELLLKVFCDAYEIYGTPTDTEHQAISAQVGALLRVRD